MLKLLIMAFVQSLTLAFGQVLLKYALQRVGPFAWSWEFWGSVLSNWQFALCGVCYIASSVFWVYIIKNYPFSQAYPMISLSYVLGMIAAIVFFHEEVALTQWLGVILIMGGCVLIAK